MTRTQRIWRVVHVRVILPHPDKQRDDKETLFFYRNLEDRAVAARRHVPAEQAAKLWLRPAKSPRWGGRRNCEIYDMRSWYHASQNLATQKTWEINWESILVGGFTPLNFAYIDSECAGYAWESKLRVQHGARKVILLTMCSCLLYPCTSAKVFFFFCTPLRGATRQVPGHSVSKAEAWRTSHSVETRFSMHVLSCAYYYYLAENEDVHMFLV